MDIGLDNSVLSDCGSNPERSASCAEKIQAVGGKLFVPCTALEEFLDNSPNQIEENGANLGRLTESLRDSFNITRPLGAIFKEEIEHKFERQPVLSRQFIRQICTILENRTFGGKSNHFEKPDLGEQKDRFFDLDERVISEARSRFEANDVASLYLKYSGPETTNTWLAPVTTRNPSFRIEGVLKAPKRFRAMYLWALLGDLYAIGLAIDQSLREKTSETKLHGLRRDRGSHHDNRAMAECAYCDVFLTNDARFKKRALHAKSLGLHDITVLTLDEFLAIDRKKIVEKATSNAQSPARPERELPGASPYTTRCRA